MAILWTIKGGGLETFTPLADAGIADLNLQFQSRSVDRMSFTVPVADATSAPLFPFGSTVILRRDGTQVFVGTVQTAPEAVMSGRSEALRFTVLGPWWWFENVVYQQAWKARSGDGFVTEHKSHLVLNQDANGNRITNGAQIADAVQWAIGAGALLQTGVIFAGITAPTRDASDLTVAEVIKTSLKWTPDASTWFDYSTSPPTFHCRRRAELTPVTKSVTDGVALEDLSIAARHDLRVPSVTLKYEQENSDDGSVWTSTTVDTYPAGSSEQQPKAIVQTLQLSGSRVTRQTQTIVTRPLPAPSATANGIVNWFQKRNSWLAETAWKTSIPVEKIGVVSNSFYTKMEPTEQFASDGTTVLDDGWTTENLPRELVDGSISEWMETAYPSLKTGQLKIGAMLTFTGNPDDFPIEGDKYYIRHLFNMDDTGPLRNTLWVEEWVMATNAQTLTYSSIASSDAGENAPTGLAQALYESLGTLHYEGHARWTQEEIAADVTLANKLNLSGGMSEWATMNAQVQTIGWAVDRGEVTVKFGPPEHLSPQDMVEFLRGIRTSTPSYATAERTTGVSGSNSVVSGPGKSPVGTPRNPPGGGGGTVAIQPFQLIDASTSDTTQLRVVASYIYGVTSASLGFSPGDDPPYILAVSGSGFVWLGFTISTYLSGGGEITSAWIEAGSDVPGNSADGTTFYVEIGSYSVTDGVLTVSNTRYGPIALTIRRNWFAGGEPYWSPAW